MGKLPSQQKAAPPQYGPGADEFTDEFGEAPTEKRSIPDALKEPPPPVYVTTKLRRAEIDALLAVERTERPGSGLRPALPANAVGRYRQGPVDDKSDTIDESSAPRGRETLPAPPNDDDDEA